MQGYIQETGFDPCQECNPNPGSRIQTPDAGDAESALHEQCLEEASGPHGQG